MRGENPLVGMVGLMEMVDPPLEPRGHDVLRLGFGSVMLVLSTSDAAPTAAAIPLFGGQIVMPIVTARNIGDQDGNYVPAKLFMAYDPDGTFLEVFEPL